MEEDEWEWIVMGCSKPGKGCNDFDYCPNCDYHYLDRIPKFQQANYLKVIDSDELLAEIKRRMGTRSNDSTAGKE
jgi:hypothetical protein